MFRVCPIPAKKLFSIQATLFIRSPNELPKKKNEMKLPTVATGGSVSLHETETERWEWKRNGKRDRKFSAFQWVVVVVHHAVSEESEVNSLACGRECRRRKKKRNVVVSIHFFAGSITSRLCCKSGRISECTFISHILVYTHLLDKYTWFTQHTPHSLMWNSEIQFR